MLRAKLNAGVKRWWPYATFALGIALAIWASTISPSYEDCSANHHKQYADPEKGEPPPKVHRTFSQRAIVFAECEGEFIHANEGIILAVSTIFLALFTLALWRSTDALWKAGERQISVAEKAATAAAMSANAALGAEAAHIWVDEIRVEFREVEKDVVQLFLGYAILNEGQTPGFVTKVPLVVAISPTLPEEESIRYPDAPAAQTLIAPKGRRVVENIPAQRFSRAELDLLTKGQSGFIFVIGVVEFRDIFDRPRSAGFAYKMVFKGPLVTAQPQPHRTYWRYT